MIKNNANDERILTSYNYCKVLLDQSITHFPILVE